MVFKKFFSSITTFLRYSLPFIITLFLCFLPIFSSLVHAEDLDKTEGLILESAEKFFISLKEKNYKVTWELLSERSRSTIVNDVYETSKDMGINLNKNLIEDDFNSNGAISQNYWNALINNFDPNIVLEERVWEFEKIKPDYAVILLKNKNIVTRLKMYKEENLWKVGFVETFWIGKTQKIIKYLLSLLS
jgi:hypothetical protein